MKKRSYIAEYGIHDTSMLNTIHLMQQTLLNSTTDAERAADIKLRIAAIEWLINAKRKGGIFA